MDKVLGGSLVGHHLKRQGDFVNGLYWHCLEGLKNQLNSVTKDIPDPSLSLCVLGGHYPIM